MAEALADGSTRIIAGGGDGTINAVVPGLLASGRKKPVKTVLGILPLGTANDFAHGLGLHVENLSLCFELACTRPPRGIDVGKANARYFINVTSGGNGSMTQEDG